MAVVQIKSRSVLFRMTSDQFCELPPSEEYKLELLDGEVIVAARPRINHQHFVFQLAVVAELWLRPRKLGRLLLDSLMMLDGKWSPAPDLVFVARQHLTKVKQKRIEGPVDLAVEVLSPTNPEVDRDTKFEAYAQFGIPWYWIVDLTERRLDEYKLGRGRYGSPVTVGFDKPFAPRVFPGLKIDLASLEW